MKSRGRRLAVACGAGGVVVLFFFVVVSWQSLLEIWWISKLDSSDDEVRAQALERLQAVGGERTARRLLRDLREGGKLGEGLVSALRDIYPRLEAGKLLVIQGLLDDLKDEPSVQEGEILIRPRAIS